MKIINTQAGQAYDLEPGTQIEMERTNLFFNEWGEQSVPMELPDTDRNRALCGYPDLAANVKRPSADIPCRIQDGAFCQPARQAILGARRGESISTAFYLGEGSFLAKLDETLVSDVFGDETVNGCETVEECIEFCQELADGSLEDKRFAIFPCLLQGDQTDEDGNTVFEWLNRYGYETSSGTWNDYVPTNGNGSFYNATARTLQDGEDTIHIPTGCYIAPFLRANYVLKRVLAHFGYELQDNFFTRTQPFPDMVLVHNCCDALLAGRIFLADLVPNCTCATLLDVFRKKFCCEFVTDEAAGTVTIVLMNEVLDAAPQADLTPYVVGHTLLETPDAYKRIVLQSDDHTESDLDGDNPENLASMLKDYKYIKLDGRKQAYCRRGFKFSKSINGRVLLTVSYLQDLLTDASMPYDAGDSTETEEVSVPDCQLTMRQASPQSPSSRRRYDLPTYPYIGEGKFCHSLLIPESGSVDSGETEEGSSSGAETPVMLAFYGRVDNMPCGTVTGTVEGGIHGQYLSLGNYSLLYIGPKGLFERFWRKMDALYRNSLLTLTANLLLPQAYKQDLNPHLPIMLQNQKLLPDIIRYTVGGEAEPQDCTFRTVRLYEPVEQAPDVDSYVTYTGSTDEYQWLPKSEYYPITQEQYEDYEEKDRLPVTIYPDAPKEEYDDGGKHYLQGFYQKVADDYYYIRVWLECHPTGYVSPEPDIPTTNPGGDGGDEEEGGTGTGGSGDNTGEGVTEDPLA